MGDNPRLEDNPYDTTVDSPPTLQDTECMDSLCLNMLRESERMMLEFAAAFPGEVFAFPQIDLWLDADGKGNNRVPGTSLNAYNDNNHLSVGGSKYLSPYLCAALEDWGLFLGGKGDSSPAVSTADWRETIRKSGNLTRSAEIQCHNMLLWAGGGGYEHDGIRLHGCENVTDESDREVIVFNHSQKGHDGG